MKRKVINLGVILVLLFSFGLIVGPASPAAGQEVYATGYSDYTLGNYDVRYVAKYENNLTPGGLAGSDSTGDGSISEPWRRITYAISQLPFNSGTHMDDPFGSPTKPDMIVVGQSVDPIGGNGGYYGGTSDPENIVILPQHVDVGGVGPLVIVSRFGSDVTNIDVSNQGYISGGVIEIKASNVIIDDFTIVSNGSGGGGSATGVYAHGQIFPPYDPIENVQVLNCHIKIDQYIYEGGVGIEMYYVKYAVIDNNNIDVGIMGGDVEVGPESLSMAFGILMYGCFQAQITLNELDVQGDYWAVGISMTNCPKSMVGVIRDDSTSPPTYTAAANNIEVKAGSDVLAWGIYVSMSDLIDIMYNTVAVEATGDFYAAAYGIQVCFSDRIDIIQNTVYVESNLPDSIVAGFMMARGIAIKGCNGPNNVSTNVVNVLGTGYVSETLETFDADADVAEDLAEFEPILLQALGIDWSFVNAVGSAVGISISCSPSTTVATNNVGVNLTVRINSGADLDATGQGGGCAIGISGLGSPGITVSGNTVSVYDYVYAQVIAEYVGPDQFAIGDAASVSLGIILDNSPGAVVGNLVNKADADLTAYIRATDTVGVMPPGAEDSALARLDAEILGAIYLQLFDALADETIDVQLNGDPPGILTSGSGTAAAVGIGIMVMNTYGVGVIGNSPVNGTGDVILDVISSEVDWHDAFATGGGTGLGIGIAIIDTRAATIDSNTAVYGAGTADVSISATDSSPVSPTNASACGGGNGIGAGILLCGMHGYKLEAEQLPEDQCWADAPVVTNNDVEACGKANPIVVSATELTPSEESCACGSGLALAMGIAAVWYPGILIEGNTVYAGADASVNTNAQAVHSFDPSVIGGATAIGVGITTINCLHASILNNIATGDAMAYSVVGATENVALDWVASAFGGSLAEGVGILVIGCPCSLVEGNSVLDDSCHILQKTTGRGHAECSVIATNYIPLNSAYATSLATGIGIGIEVAYSPCTDVLNCNVAAGEGTAQVYAEYDADFGSDYAAGFAGSYDILMKLMHCYPGYVEEEEADSEQGPPPMNRFGDVNYNSMVDPDSSLGTNYGPVATEDAGLLKIGMPGLDATRNWWNDATGPSGYGPGNGEKVLWSGHPVSFVPWLYVEHGEVLCQQVGKFGFYLTLCKGLNTLSTPIALEARTGVIPGYQPSRTWGDIMTNNGLDAGDFKYTYRWDSSLSTPGWVPVDNDTPLDPLDAWYVYLRDTAPTNNLILFINSADAFGAEAHPYSMPTRQLYAGWNLIGPNPQFSDPGMPVEEALSSVELTSAGTPGYTQVISPLVNCQEAWVYVPDGKKGPGECMLIGKGYWVWMLNDIVLVGFGFSPLPAP